jgi:hypothetical protein
MTMTSCGIKGPPVLPAPEMPFRVTSLTVDWGDNGFELKGIIQGTEGQMVKPSDLTGCRLYHAFFAPESPPCEGCPIDYKKMKRAEHKILSPDRFSCLISGKVDRGIHYFKIRLLGSNDEIGPFSDEVKIIVEDHEEP